MGGHCCQCGRLCYCEVFKWGTSDKDGLVNSVQEQSSLFFFLTELLVVGHLTSVQHPMPAKQRGYFFSSFRSLSPLNGKRTNYKIISIKKLTKTPLLCISLVMPISCLKSCACTLFKFISLLAKNISNSFKLNLSLSRHLRLSSCSIISRWVFSLDSCCLTSGEEEFEVKNNQRRWLWRVEEQVLYHRNGPFSFACVASVLECSSLIGNICLLYMFFFFSW